MANKLPSWIKVKAYNRKKYTQMLSLLRKNNLNTVCIEANCPNRYECFSNGTATFMILGNICTRNCLYCNVETGEPKEVDAEEPKRIAKAVKELKLNYVVITCVTRDDLEDCGAEQFVKCVKEIRNANPNCRIELLISDLKGDYNYLEKIINIAPDVINHNIEVVKHLFPTLRPQASYECSLYILKTIKKINPNIITKSGLMVGLGETKQQIMHTFKDLKEVGTDILTIGQYLQPTKQHAKVEKYYTSDEFDKFTRNALSLGFKKVFSGPLVRSSYRAGCW